MAARFSGSWTAGLLTDRLTIAHGVWITQYEVERLGNAGANPSCNPMSNLKLLNGAAPVRIYGQAGVGLALGCDNCSGNDAQNMLEAMKAFALLWSLSGEAGASGAAARAFGAATLGGARALGLAGEIGDIAPGCRADLAMLRLDDPAFVPLNSAVRQLVYAATPRAVDTVMVGGQIVVRDGSVTAVDAGASRAVSEWCAADLCACQEAIARRFNPARDAILAIHRRIACEPLDIDRMRLGSATEVLDRRRRSGRTIMRRGARGSRSSAPRTSVTSTSRRDRQPPRARLR